MRVHVALLLIPFTALVSLTGCQTGQKEPAPYPRAASKIPFLPQMRQASLQSGEGAYPNLYTGASYAIWAPQSDTNRMEADEAALERAAAEADAEDPATIEEKMEGDLEVMPPRRPPRRGPLVIECMLESVFPDRSIAYDAVGLRGMEIHLALPDGQQVLPVQKTLDPDLEEIPVGALRRYKRKLTLQFPTNSFLVENPAANPAVKGVRLVLSGHGSTFYFEWLPLPDTLAKTEPRIDYQVREAVKKGYVTTSGRLKRVSHTFD